MLNKFSIKLRMIFFIIFTIVMLAVIAFFSGPAPNNSLILFGVSAVSVICLGFILMTSIIKPIQHLEEVIQGLSMGEFDERAKVRGSDEMAQLSQSFNELLDNRAISIQQIDSGSRPSRFWRRRPEKNEQACWSRTSTWIHR